MAQNHEETVKQSNNTSSDQYSDWDIVKATQVGF